MTIRHRQFAGPHLRALRRRCDLRQAEMAARLAEKVEVDAGTARRLFTLVSVLHWKT